MKPFANLIAAFAELSVDEIDAYIAATVTEIDDVSAAPAEFVTEELSAADLLASMTAAVESVKAARAELASREPETLVEELAAVEPDAPADVSVFADLAALAHEDDPDEVEEIAEVEETKAEAVVASATEQQPQLRAPARSRRAAPQESTPVVSLTAAAGATDMHLGAEFPSMLEVAEAMIRRRKQFGLIPSGASDKEPIARADWSHLYPAERTLSLDPGKNEVVLASALDEKLIRQEMVRRQKLGVEGALLASGGLCAPVTPYYNLQMISVADRPVRAALPAFNADRGGITAASPASLADITTAVGVITAAEDAAGGTSATKSCQVVDCPDFTEYDVDSIYHCLQFGNLGARTFPERVAQWTSLTLAAHSRLAESGLLTAIGASSTAVTAANLGLGASATLPSQILTAAAGMRSRHRMTRDAVLRVLLPSWVLDLLVSDVYRTQFERFDMSPEQFIAVLRDGNVEPSFYIDGANGAGQVFDTQSAGTLLSFPSTAVWYLYPEGSFLFLDAGTLELGIVRDSVLNETNDFQIFGETFETLAYVGVESLAVTSTVCDSGTVALPHAVSCPIVYTHSS